MSRKPYVDQIGFRLSKKTRHPFTPFVAPYTAGETICGAVKRLVSRDAGWNRMRRVNSHTAKPSLA